MKQTLTLCAFLIASASSAVTVSVSVTDAHCGLANGGAVATATGGLPPYTYSWDTGATTSDLVGLLPGSYTVTVTDALSNTAQATGVVNNVQSLVSPYSWETRPDCASGCTGWATINEFELAGTPPYNYDWVNPYLQGGQVTFMGVCSWPGNTVAVTDANGCAGTISLAVSNAMFGQPEVLNTTSACGTQANGTATINGMWSYAYFQVTPLAGGPVQYFEFFAPPYTLTGLAAGDYEVLLWDPIGYPPFFGPGAVYCSFPTQFTIGALTEPCGSLTGTVYHDADQNCVFNGFDLKQPYRVITIDPIGGYAISDGQGQYQQNVNYGTYELSQDLPANEAQICPVISPQPATVDAANPNVNTDFANLSTVPHDLALSIWSSDARPGFPTTVHMSVINPTAFPSGNVSVDLGFDPLLLSPVPASGHWDLGVLAPYAYEHFQFNADVPANINLLGTVMNYSATLTNTATESSLANNTVSLDVTITGSYDPNDKQGVTSSGLSPNQYFLSQDEWIDYTVRFQNTGTAAAETVVIRDTIDADLFIPSLEILGASHPFTPSFGMGRELVFTFAEINLPDSTTDLPGSQGFISYRIKPNSGITVGTLLENTAGIYFDFNSPIITNTVSHVVDFSTGVNDPVRQQISVVPNPATDVVNVLLPEGGGTAVQILSIDGRTIQVPVLVRANNVQLDLRSLAPGTYAVLTATGSARFMKR